MPFAIELWFRYPIVVKQEISFLPDITGESPGRSSVYKFLIFPLNPDGFHEAILQPLDGDGLQGEGWLADWNHVKIRGLMSDV